jgi:hypothetical protein
VWNTVHPRSYWSATQETLLLLNPAVHDIPTPRQTNLTHILSYFLCKYSSNSVLPSTPEVFKVYCLSGAFVLGTALHTGRSRLKLFIKLVLPAALGPWSRHKLFNANEYPEYFLVGKGGRCVWLTLPPSCAFLESGSLNLLEPSGPVQGLLYLYHFPFKNVFVSRVCHTCKTRIRVHSSLTL